MSTRIVILGGGFAGAYGAQALGRRLRGRGDVVVIDRNNYFVFHPLLVEAGTGSLEPRHVVVPIRALLGKGALLMGEIDHVDLEASEVTCRIAGGERVETVRYDHLVVALGSITRMPRVPGLRERGFGLKDLADAVALRDRAIRLLETANAIDDDDARRALLHLVVVGGNYTGVEVAGEFDEFMRRAARTYPNVRPDECRMTLVEREARILGALGDELSAFALRHLRKRGIDVRLETTVEAIEDDAVTLSGGDRLPTRTVIWCAGVAPNPLVARLGLPLDEQGYIRCSRDLRVEGHERVWAIGDAAVNPGPDGTPYPATAQHAVREGAHLARNIEAVLAVRPTTPCDLKGLGSLAAIGCRTGVARVFGVKLSGFPAWFVWRTVYLMKMPRWSRRVRVALDWTLDLLFSRDVVQLGVHRRERPEGARDDG